MTIDPKAPGTSQYVSSTFEIYTSLSSLKLKVKKPC